MDQVCKKWLLGLCSAMLAICSVISVCTLSGVSAAESAAEIISASKIVSEGTDYVFEMEFAEAGSGDLASETLALVEFNGKALSDSAEITCAWTPEGKLQFRVPQSLAPEAGGMLYDASSYGKFGGNRVEIAQGFPYGEKELGSDYTAAYYIDEWVIDRNSGKDVEELSPNIRKYGEAFTTEDGLTTFYIRFGEPVFDFIFSNAAGSTAWQEKYPQACWPTYYDPNDPARVEEYQETIASWKLDGYKRSFYEHVYARGEFVEPVEEFTSVGMLMSRESRPEALDDSINFMLASDGADVMRIQLNPNNKNSVADIEKCTVEFKFEAGFCLPGLKQADGTRGPDRVLMEDVVVSFVSLGDAIDNAVSSDLYHSDLEFTAEAGNTNRYFTDIVTGKYSEENYPPVDVAQDVAGYLVLNGKNLQDVMEDGDTEYLNANGVAVSPVRAEWIGEGRITLRLTVHKDLLFVDNGFSGNVLDILKGLTIPIRGDAETPEWEVRRDYRLVKYLNDAETILTDFETTWDKVGVTSLREPYMDGKVAVFIVYFDQNITDYVMNYFISPYTFTAQSGLWDGPSSLLEDMSNHGIRMSVAQNILFNGVSLYDIMNAETAKDTAIIVRPAADNYNSILIAFDQNHDCSIDDLNQEFTFTFKEGMKTPKYQMLDRDYTFVYDPATKTWTEKVEIPTTSDAGIGKVFYNGNLLTPGSALSLAIDAEEFDERNFYVATNDPNAKLEWSYAPVALGENVFTLKVTASDGVAVSTHTFSMVLQGRTDPPDGSTGLVIGLSVGGGVLVLAAAAAVTFILLKRRKSDEKE